MMDTSCRLQFGFPRQRYNGNHSSTLWHSQEQRHFRAHSCAPWHMAIVDKGNTVRGQGGSHSLCSAPPHPKQQQTMTNPQKLHLPSQAMSLLCWLSFAQVPVLQFHHAGGQSHRLLLLSYSSAALLSAQRGWVWLSSAPVGWAPFSWTGVTPTSPFPAGTAIQHPSICISALSLQHHIP